MKWLLSLFNRWFYYKVDQNRAILTTLDYLLDLQQLSFNLQYLFNARKRTHHKLHRLSFVLLRDDTHMTSIKIIQFSRPPNPFFHLRPKFFHLVDLGRPISNEPPTSHFQMVTNQLKDNIIQGWLSYIIRSFLQVDFRIQYQLINLVWLFFDFFSFSWSLTICFVVAL